MPTLVFGILILVLVLWLLNAYSKADPKMLARLLPMAGGIGALTCAIASAVEDSRSNGRLISFSYWSSASGQSRTSWLWSPSKANGRGTSWTKRRVGSGHTTWDWDLSRVTASHHLEDLR